jgi:hypothetical protein
MFSLENLPLDNWRTLISQYTQKDLTFPKDILPALSGVANRIRGGGAYYGGLWEKTFVYDLLWFPTVSRNISPIRLPSTGPNYVAPSFLWASVKGPISFIDVLRKSTSKKIVKTLRSHSVTCERRGHDILGELSGGVLIVTAPVIFADFNHHLQAMSANFFIKHLKMEEDCNWATLKIDDGDHYIFHPDSQDSDLSQERLCIVKLFESSELHNNTCYGLVLTIEKPTRNVEELHCLRVGIIASLDKILFETERTVHIH